MQNVKITIKKTLYGNTVAIRDIYVKQAFRTGVKLEITVPNGTAAVDPKWWVETGKKIKKVFLKADEPMILYQNSVPLPYSPPPKFKRKEIEPLQKSLFKKI